LSKRTVSGITLTLLFIGMLTLTFNIQSVKASGTIKVGPQGVKGGYVSSNDLSPAEHVVINEFDQNPPGWDYEGGEWVELFNPTENDVDLSGWKLFSTQAVTMPEGSRIAAEEFWTYTHETHWLKNEDESIILRDADGNEIDRTPTTSDTEDDNGCWARFPNGNDTDSDADWRFVSSRLSTKGYSNTITVVESGDKEDLKVGEKRKLRTYFEVGILVSHYDYKVIECPEFISYSAYFVQVPPYYGLPSTDYIHSIVHLLPSAKLGTYDLRVKWAWSDSVFPPEEWKYVYELHLTVNITAPTTKFDTDVSLFLEEEVVSPGSSVHIKGNASVYDRESKICPLPSTDLTLTYEKPDGNTFNQSITTDKEGEFSYYGVYDTGLWKVKARLKSDPARNGAESPWVSFTVADTTPPMADAGPDQTVKEGTLVTFDGSESLDNIDITSYNWTFMDVTPQTLTGVNPTYTFTALGTYTITLKVTDAAGNSATDTVTIMIFDETNPVAVSLQTPTVDDITEGSVNLTWTESMDADFARYEIYQSTSSGVLGITVASVTDKKTTGYKLTELSPDTTYYFRVRVVDIGGLHADSNQVKAKTDATQATPPPTLPPLEIIIGLGVGLGGTTSAVALIIEAWRTGKSIVEILRGLKKILTWKKRKKKD
jgi:PKD repeat protein